MAAMIGVLVNAAPTSAAPLDVHNVAVRYANVRVDESIAGYLAEFVVEGTGLTGVTAKNWTTNQEFTLVNTAPEIWVFDNTFGSLSLFNAMHGNPVAYLFTFNPGQPTQDAIILSFNVAPPDNYVNILTPAHLGSGVNLDPLYSWDPVTPGGYQLGMRVRRQDNGTVVHQLIPEYDLTRTTWQPGALEPGMDYNFAISDFDIMNGKPIDAMTGLGDAIVYYGFYEDANEHRFTTVVPIPEPMSLMLVGSGVAGAIGVIRRRRMR